MGKVEDLVPGLELGDEPPDDPLFITLFPNPDDGSVTVVEPDPEAVPSSWKAKRPRILGECITPV